MGQAKRRKLLDPNYGKVSTGIYKKPSNRQFKLMQSIERCIQDPGWQVLAVGSEDYMPGFAYTIGFQHSFNHPEIMSVALPPATAANIFNSIGDYIKKGNKLVVDQPYTEFSTLPLIFKSIEPEYKENYFGAAINYYTSKDAFDVLQMVWCDKEGNFPWEDSCDIQMRFIQPVLYT